jgi:predicted TIM-barrel fold metal-dependent hydrolase
MKGAMINSHTFGQYLDAPKYSPLFEALEALNAPLYIHPREPADAVNAAMTGPVCAAAWAYGVEVGMHVLRLIQTSLFDRFPKLRIIVGHEPDCRGDSRAIRDFAIGSTERASLRAQPIIPKERNIS